MANELAGLSVLVLEDEYLIAMDVEHLCLEHGASNVTIVKDLATLRSPDGLPHYDVAILDLMIGGESTVNLAGDLQERGVPFVFATGYSDLGEHAPRFPGVAIVSKPYSGADLIEALALAARTTRA